MSDDRGPRNPQAAEIARRVAHFLELNGWKQAELARRLGVSAVHAHRIVRAGSISSELLLQVPSALGVTPAYFWGVEIPEDAA